MKTSILFLVLFSAMSLGISSTTFAQSNYGPTNEGVYVFSDPQGPEAQQQIKEANDAKKQKNEQAMQVARSRGGSSTQSCAKKCEGQRSSEGFNSCKSECEKAESEIANCGQTINGKKYRSCDKTQIINAGLDGLDTAQQFTNTMIQSRRGTKETERLANQSLITNSDSYSSQADLAKGAAKLNLIQASTQSAAAVYQGVMAAQHLTAASKARKALAQRQLDLAKATTPEEVAIINNDIVRLTQEQKGQSQMGVKQGVTAAMTGKKAATTMQNVNEMNAAAARLAAQAKAAQDAGVSYSYGQQTATGGDEGTLNPTLPTDTGAITSTDPAGNPLDGGFKDFNPNVGQDGTLGPQAGAFKEGPVAGTGGGQGSGLGGSGGTSASRGDGEAKQDATAGKPQTGGQYAAGDGASPKFSRSGGSAGVGVDPSFADMMKKMLPGGDEDKKEGQASLDLNEDRAPASDQAAVIGRNKNIFIEISKRYQKKHSEGAVTFQ